MNVNFDTVKELRKTYLDTMRTINTLPSWEIAWDFKETDTTIPTEGPSVVYLPDTMECEESIMDIVMAGGVLITDNEDEFIVSVAANTEEEALMIATNTYKTNFKLH